MNRHFFSEFFLFVTVKACLFLFTFFVLGSFTQLGDSANYLRGSFSGLSFGSTLFVTYLGAFFGKFGFVLGNFVYVSLHSILTFLLLVSGFSRRERYFYYICSLFPTVGAFSLIYGKESLLIFFVIFFFWSHRKGNILSLFFSFVAIALLKPVWGLVLLLWLFSTKIGLRFGFRLPVLFICSSYFLSVLLAVYFLRDFDKLNIFLRGFHYYFSNGSTSFATQFSDVFDLLTYLPLMLFAWFIPQAVEFLDLKFLLFDIEGSLFLIFLGSIVFPFRRRFILSYTLIYFWVFLFIFCTVMGPYSLFNLGSTLRYRSGLFYILLFLTFETIRFFRYSHESKDIKL